LARDENLLARDGKALARDAEEALQEVTQSPTAGARFKAARDPKDPLEVQKSPSFTGKSRRLRENPFVYEKNEFSVRKIN
jgi:hypothetical protein